MFDNLLKRRIASHQLLVINPHYHNLSPAQPLPRSNAPAVLLNQSKPNAFVQQSALTTSNYTDIIHTQNPFQYDVSSVWIFKELVQMFQMVTNKSNGSK